MVNEGGGGGGGGGERRFGREYTDRGIIELSMPRRIVSQHLVSNY